MNIQIIQKKFDCEKTDATEINGLLVQASEAGSDAKFGAPANIEKHADFEDEAGLDLACIESTLLLDEGTLVAEYRKYYTEAYALRSKSPVAGRKTVKRPS